MNRTVKAALYALLSLAAFAGVGALIIAFQVWLMNTIGPIVGTTLLFGTAVFVVLFGYWRSRV